MLSAVENHFGPSRLYATGAHHPYNNNSAVAISANSNLIAAPCPIVAVPTPMSATEFVRPHPKPNRSYNGSQSLRNGLSSPSSRGRYSQLDQPAPVNLAVSQSMSDNGALVLGHKPTDRDVAALCAAAKPSSLESEQDAISSSIASLYQPHKMPYCPPHSIPDATPLYYPNFYARPTTGSVYGHSIYAAPSSHALGGARNPLHHGVATYPHVESAYSNPYLFGPNAYSPPAAARPNLSPHSPIGTITVGSASQNSNNTSISAQPASSGSPPSMFTQQQQQQHQQHQQQQQQHQQHQQHQREQREHQQYHLKPEHITSVAKPLSTYRTEAKEKESIISNGKSADFKIPSGKEGSLKHRILTRPTYGDKESTAKQTQKQQSLPTHSQNNTVTKSSVKIKNNNSSNSNNSNHNGNSSNNNNNNASSKNKNLGTSSNTNGSSNNNSSSSATNFSKGTLIELSSGELRRVEDMRTEDFITSSSKNPNLQLIDTTVVKMTSQSKTKVLITLSYNNNKICMDTQPSHPFFVYGKGWSSFSPDETLHEHGLKCNLLEIGDVCISLTPREQQARTSLEFSITSPQNLSRKQMPHTISTTATGTAVTSWPIPSFEPSYMHHRHPNELIYGHHHHHHHGRPLNSDASRNYSTGYSTTMAPPPPPPSSSSESSASNSYDDEAIDATMHSRKRRAWSVPENNCDDQKKNKPN